MNSECPFVGPTGGRAIRVLDLQPSHRSAGLIRQVEPLRDDAFAAEPAGLGEDRGAITLEVLVERDRAAGAREKPPQVVLALQERQRGDVDAVELEQVERTEGDELIVGPRMQQVEVGETITGPGDNPFTVNQYTFGL